jgi:hypothetical protein
LSAEQSEPLEPSGKILGSSIPILSRFFLVVCVACLIAAVVYQAADMGFVAAGSLLAAIVCWSPRRPGREFRLGIDGLQLDSGTNFLWQDLISCDLGGRRISPNSTIDTQRNSITLNFGKNQVRIRSNAPQNDGKIYKSLWNVILSGHKAKLTPELSSVYEKWLVKFGPEELVAAGTGTDNPSAVNLRGRVIIGFWVMFIGCFLGVIAVPQATAAPAIATISVIVAVTTTIIYLIDYSRRKRLRQVCGILLSPERLALQTKDLKGEMKWSELRELQLLPSSAKPQKLRLRMPGVDIVLLDQFQLPLWYLYERACFFRDNYRPTPQATIPIAPSLPQTELVEDFNPYRPPKT